MTFSLQSILNKTTQRKACALMGPYKVFIDHTAPICALLDIPMITADPKVKFTYEHLYPGLKCLIKEWSLDYLLKYYSTVFYAFRPNTSFAQEIKSMQKKEPDNPIWKNQTKFIYHLHGCSDKGYHSGWIAPKSHFLDVDQVLFYGRRMKDIFKDNQVLERLRSYALIGNYRYLYYLENKDFYKKVIQKEVFSHFEKEQPTLLYAPSWTDPEGSCSLFKAYKTVLDNLPGHYNLILKLHPYLSIKTPEYDPAPLYELLSPYSSRPNIEIVPMLPLIYPILDRVVAYIGDYSSIGYDALSFKLPLFFLNHNERDLQDKGAYLVRCGREVKPNEFKDLYSIIEEELATRCPLKKEQQKEVYAYAFGEDCSYSDLKERFIKLLT